MGESPRSRLISFRSLLVAAMVLFSVLGLRAGWLVPLPEPGPATWASLYRRAGDTCVRIFSLAAADVESPAGRALLGNAADYYSRSVKADPANVESATSLGLTLHALGKADEARRAITSAALRTRQGPEGDALKSTLAVLRGDASLAQVDRAKPLLSKLAPGPLVLAAAYEKLGRPDLRDEQLDLADSRAARVEPALVALVAAFAVLACIGLIGLVVALVRRMWRWKPAPPARWGVREAIESLIVWVFLAIITSSLLAFAVPAGKDPAGALLLIPSLVAGCGAILWVWVTAGRPRFGWAPTGLASGVGWGLAAAGLLAPASLLLGRLLERALGPSEHPLTPILAGATNWGSRALLILAACVAIPVLEETIFRGILYRGLRRNWAVAPAAATSALIFAVGHLSPAGFLPYVLIGLVFAWVYEKTGSLVAPAVAHGAFNAFNFMILLILFG